MDSYLVAIPLPANLRSRLASLCFGLPQVHWVDEENFHLTLRYLGHLTTHQLEDVQEKLSTLFFHSFTMTLQGIRSHHSKNHQGSIQLGLLSNPALLTLKKEVNACLTGLDLLKEEHPFIPHVTLGYFEKLHSEKWGDYLTTYADFQSLPIEVNDCLLLSSHQTPKRFYYKIIEKYQAALIERGED